MRKLLNLHLHLLGVIMILLSFSLPVEAQRKRVAVVMSGGGAKGVAHIGTLKMLEDLGIPIDMVVGTSMGALVGGLYSIGYSADAIDSIVRTRDWGFLLSDKSYRSDLSVEEREREDRFLFTLPFAKVNSKQQPIGFLQGQNVYKLLTDLTIGYHGDVDFSKLPIPYVCVAADLLTRKEKIFTEGNLVMAMRASMAIPGFFTPVETEEMVLVDGGVLNNLPTDVAKALGADIVIAVDVQAELMSSEKLRSVSNVIPQLIDLLCMNKYQENLKLADIVIRPDVAGYSAASFNRRAIDTLLKRGELAALRAKDELIQLQQRERLKSDSIKIGHYKVFDKEEFPIGDIIIEGVSPEEERWLLRKITLKKYSEITMTELHRQVNMLYGTRYFSTVNYRLVGEETPDLIFGVTPSNSNNFHIGFRFDSKDMAAILLSATWSNRMVRNSQISITGRLSQNPRMGVEFSLENTFLRRFSLAGEFHYNDINIYHRGKKNHNVTYRYYMGELGVSNLYFRNFSFGMGLKYEYYDYNSFLYNGELKDIDIHSEGFFSYNGLVRWENLDRSYFPQRGFSFKADYSLYTDNFVSYKGEPPFSALALEMHGIISITDRFKLIPTFYGRVLIGKDHPYAYYNCMGGVVQGRWIAQQLPFWGIPRMEIFDRSLIVGRLQVRHRIGSRNYLSVVTNIAMDSDNFGDILRSNIIRGEGVAYSYDSMIGPIDVTLSWSNRVKRPEIYLNIGFYF